MTIDRLFWLYLLTMIFSSYGFGLFVWWWKKMGSATAMYKYITFLLLGIAIQNLGNLCHRELPYDIRCTNYLWHGRLYLMLGCVMLIVIHMSYRAFYKRKRLEHEHNSKEGQM